MLSDSSTIQFTGSISQGLSGYLEQVTLLDFGVCATFDAQNIITRHSLCRLSGVYSVGGGLVKTPLHSLQGHWCPGAEVTGSPCKVLGATELSCCVIACGCPPAKAQLCMMLRLRPFAISVSEVNVTFAPVRCTNVYSWTLTSSPIFNVTCTLKVDVSKSICSTHRAFGVTNRTLKIKRSWSSGENSPQLCIVDSCNDHRIVMMATILAHGPTGLLSSAAPGNQ